MKKTSLEKLIFKNYIIISLVSIICIEVILISLYFFTNYAVIDKISAKDVDELNHKVLNTVKDKKELLSQKFSQIESAVKILQDNQQNFLKNDDYIFFGKVDFDYSKNGMYFKTKPNSISSVVVSSRTNISSELIKELEDTEIFDLVLKSTVDYNNDIQAAHFSSHKNYIRYYPSLDNVFDVYPSDLNLKNYSFYFLADEKNNPEKKVVWTEVYLDPAKKGWILSAVAPIYKNEKFEGVTAVDIKLDKFIDSFLNLHLPYDGKSFLINSEGKIIGMQTGIEELLGKKELEEYQYRKDEKVYTTISKSQSFNILNHENKEFAKNVLNSIKKDTNSFIETFKDKSYMVYTQNFNGPNWSIVSIIDQEKMNQNLTPLKNRYNLLGYIIIGSIIIFYIFFLIYLKNKSRKLLNKVNKPIKDIIKIANDLATKENVKKLPPNEIVEIDELNDVVNKLVIELNNRTKNLIDEESRRIYNERLANTDSLTGAFNRRYLEDFTLNYLKIVKRENRNLSLLIIDLDNFKDINDNYGHHKGDELLVEFVKLIKMSVRDNDLVVRYGGDEFIVLLPDATKESARYVAQKIKTNIYEYSEKNDAFTVSIGISNYQTGDVKIDDIIKRADEALYEAKNRGKDKIVYKKM